MRKLSALWTLVAYCTLFLLLFGREAYAYLDPGSGSYILQVVLGFFVGALFAAKIYWQKVKNFIRKIFSGHSKDPDNDR